MAGFFFGFNPYRTSDEKLAGEIAGSPLYRITPARVVPAAFVPGGTGWVGSTLAWLALAVILIVSLIR